MKPGDLIRFNQTAKIGTIISVKKGSHYTEVKVLHNTEGIQNPTRFSLGELRRTAEVINETTV